ncbi:unnamed protein product [Toxocara canis]|uniref:SAM-dependent methyltransferase n=1 Tax=Toxocara canis TaxID=6265 RepID=A0A183ULG0_TOXCA|nr:unnamed protein product [Toxocara canis]
MRETYALAEWCTFAPKLLALFDSAFRGRYSNSIDITG